MNIHDALNVLYGVNIGLAVGYWWRSVFAPPVPPDDTPRPPIYAYGRQYQRAAKGSTVAKTARGTQPDAGSIPARSTVQNVPANVHETHTRPDQLTLNRLASLILNEYSGGTRIPREGVKLAYRDLSKYKISRTRAGVLRDYVASGLGYEDADGVVWLARTKAQAFLERRRNK